MTEERDIPATSRPAGGEDAANHGERPTADDRRAGGATRVLVHSRSPLGPSLLPTARRRGQRAGPILAVTAACALTVAFAAWGVGGASDGRPNDGASREIGQAKAQVAELDKERRRREDALADLERRKNAKESELAQTSDRVEDLEKRRAQLQTEIAELVAPVSPSGAERVLDQGGAPQTLRELDDETLASPAPLNPIPLPPSAPAASKISVDADAESPMDAPPEAQRDRPSPDGVARIARAEPETETDDAAGARTEQAIPVGGMRVFIHVRASDPAARDRARAIAAELRRHGVEVADIRGVPHAVRRDAVRYFYDADRASASLLQKAVRAASPLTDQTPMAQDFRRYSAPPRQGTVELWLS